MPDGRHLYSASWQHKAREDQSDREISDALREAGEFCNPDRANNEGFQRVMMAFQFYLAYVKKFLSLIAMLAQK